MLQRPMFQDLTDSIENFVRLFFAALNSLFQRKEI